MAPVRLETPRLILRELTESDFEAVHAYASDPEVSRYMDWGPNSDADTREWLAAALAQQGADPRVEYELAMVLRDPNGGGGGEVVGTARIGIRDRAARAADVGYVLRRDRWGQGIATEAARRLIEFGWDELGLHRIWATCDARNAGSARVLEKCRMRREARRERDQLQRGEWRDTLVYGIRLRHWMRAGTAVTADAASASGLMLRPVRLDDAEDLAHLMDRAYAGTIDHEGETPEQCLAEMRGTLEGKYGPWLARASFALEDPARPAGQRLVSASILTLWKGRPLLAWSMTLPDAQGRGHAGRLIQRSRSALAEHGHAELFLAVTEGNPAQMLYAKLGFAVVGRA
jgi:RimJ/RimL family protein N-acetyltransferase